MTSHTCKKLRGLEIFGIFPKTTCSISEDGQLKVKKLQEPSKAAKDKCVRRLAKATRMRWLSVGKVVEGVHKDYIPLMLTLKQLDQKDAQASGLLGEMHNEKFIGVVTVMHHILPVLNRLNCAFQQG